MAGYYYRDPSGLGTWYVPDNTTPAQAISDIVDQTGITIAPILSYSIANTPAAQQVNGGNPSPKTKASPPQPTSYQVQGANLVPIRANLDLGNPQAGCIQYPITYDPVTGEQLPPQCQDGYYYDSFYDLCCPAQIEPGPGTGGPPVGVSTSGNEPVTVVVNNAVTLAAGVGQAIGDATQNEIDSAINETQSAINDTSNTVLSTIGDITTKVGGLVDGIIQNVYKALSWLGNLIINNISNIVGLIKDQIGNLVSAVQSIYTTVTQTILPAIQSTVNTVNSVIANTIAPVFNTISQVYQQTNALITSIQNDVHAGITGILQLPQDISNSIGSIEASINRAIDQIGLKRQDGTSVFLDPTGADSIWNRLSTIGHGTDILGQVGTENITYAHLQKLSEPSLTSAGGQAINAVTSEIGTFISDLLSGTTRSVDAAKTGITALPLVLGVEFGTWIGLWELIRSIDQLFEPFYQFAKEDIAAKSGLSKLPVGQVLEAYKRGLIDDTSLQEDLAVNGWDSGRINVLKDLQKYVVDISTALDMHYRGIVSDSDLAATLSENGLTSTQQLAFIEQSIKLFNVNLAAQANRWGLIDDAALDAVLKQNRYSDTEITAFKATMYQKEEMSDVVTRENLTQLYTRLGFSPTGFADPSSDFVLAAQRSGIDAQSTTDHWQASFYVHSLQEWLQLYYRGIRTAGELDAAMDYYRVPQQFRDDVIQGHHALIPFRTIPTMVAAGVIDAAYAKQQLLAHGYDEVAANALLAYANIAHKKTTVAASGDVFGLSVATARSYFDMGTITADEYTQVLEAHGYDAASAALAVKVETAHAAMLNRKQLSADIVSEFKSGALTLDQATAQMDSALFSPVEKSRVLAKINAVRRTSTKIPSEAELHDMAKAGAISVDTYKQTLSQIGWAQTWIDAFVNWRFPSAPPTPATA